MAYRINSIIGPARDYIAAWKCEEGKGGPDGPVTVLVRRLDYLALANEIIRSDNDPPGRFSLSHHNDIVGVVLQEGLFRVVDEDSNFIGLFRLGDPWERILEMLHAEERDRVTPESHEEYEDFFRKATL